MNLAIIASKRIWYGISSLFVIGSLLVMLIFGLRLGIDFTGGSILEISYTGERPAPEQINEAFQAAEISSVQIQASGEDGYLIRMEEINDEKRREVIKELKAQIGDSAENTISQQSGSGAVQLQGIDIDFEDEEGNVSNRLIEERFESIGPVIGSELKGKSVNAIIIVLIAILLYIAWAFRKVSWPVQSWKYGLAAIIALFHDVVIMLGVFTLMSHLFGWEMNTAFVAAILTVVGYSVNDTIIVFDRVRENLLKASGSFEDIVNLSVNQTISRSINTSLTTLFVLVSVLLFGGETIRSFVFALTIGVLIGTYSSIFLASPLLVSAHQRGKK